MKKILSAILAVLLVTATTTGCGSSNEEFNLSNDITIVSREKGSGTRTAFIEIFGIEEKDANGDKIDRTSIEAEETNSTSVMMTTIAGNPYAIGYVSLGSLQNTVAAAKIDGADATTENVKNGSYQISRPFNIATKDNLSVVAADFVKYILSEDGQKIVEASAYISQGNEGAYDSTKPAGKIVVAGSSSVTPVMEKLKESYLKINTNATIEIEQNDSTTGMNFAIEGTCDIGMASRALKDSEKEKGLKSTVIATDGIAVIINKSNPNSSLTSEQIKNIFTGSLITWDKIK